MRKLKAIVVSALVAVVSFGAQGARTVWTGGAGTTSWTAAKNWSNGAPQKSANEEVILGEDAEVVVSARFDMTSGAIRMYEGASLTLTQMFNANSVLFYLDDATFSVDPANANTLYDTANMVLKLYGNAAFDYPLNGAPYGANDTARAINITADSRFRGGSIRYPGSFLLSGRGAIEGTDVEALYKNYSIYPKEAGAVCDLLAGSFKSVKNAAQCHGLWKKGTSVGSYLNFKPHSSFRLILPASGLTPETTYANLFSGDDARVRYDDTVLTEEAFGELFEVTVPEEGTGVQIQLKEEVGTTIRVAVLATGDEAYTGLPTRLIDLAVLHPRTGATVEYSADGGTSWSEEVPRATAGGAYSVKVRVTAEGYDDYEETFACAVPGRSLGEFVVADIPDQNCTGEPITPAVTLTHPGGVYTLTDNDYDVVYENNVNPGTAVVKITGKGNYSGTVEKTFRILAQSFAGDVYVDAASAGGTGRSWESPLANVDEACDLVQPGYAVRVKGGTYRMLKAARIDSKDGVSVLGGYAPDGTSRDAVAHPTVLTLAASASDRIVAVANVTGFTLSGVTVTGGCPNRTGGTDAWAGGGVLIEGSTQVVLSDCIVSNNVLCGTAPQNFIQYFGGGIGIRASSVEIRDSLIAENRVAEQSRNNVCVGGAGIGCVGAGARTIRNCTIRGNRITSARYQVFGGGVLNEQGTTALENCLVVENDAGDVDSFGAGNGDGVGGCGLSLKRCTVAANRGEGVSALLMRNLTGTGGAVSERRPIWIEDCVIAGNGRDLTNADAEYPIALYATNSVCGRVGGTFTDTQDLVIAARPWGAGYAPRPDVVPAGVGTSLAPAYVAPTEVSATPETLNEVLAAVSGNAVITLEEGTYAPSSGVTFPIVLHGRRNLEFRGAGAGRTVLDGEDANAWLVDAEGCVDIIFEGIGFTGAKRSVVGNSYEFGGAVRIAECAPVALTSCAFRGNSLAAKASDPVINAGGALGAYDSALEIVRCTFTDNLVSSTGASPLEKDLGGALGAVNCTVFADACSFSGNAVHLNSAAGGANYRFGGGALGLAPAHAAVRNSLFTGNTSVCAENGQVGLGNAVLVKTSGIGTQSATFDNCTFADNESTSGYDLYRNDGTVTLRNSVFTGDSVGVYATASTAIGVAGTDDPDGTDWLALAERVVPCTSAAYKDAEVGDYRLAAAPGNPLVNEGVRLDWMDANSLDLEGKKRITRRHPDLGAYEADPLGLMLLVW